MVCFDVLGGEQVAGYALSVRIVREMDDDPDKAIVEVGDVGAADVVLVIDRLKNVLNSFHRIELFLAVVKRFVAHLVASLHPSEAA